MSTRLVDFIIVPFLLPKRICRVRSIFALNIQRGKRNARDSPKTEKIMAYLVLKLRKSGGEYHRGWRC